VQQLSDEELVAEFQRYFEESRAAGARDIASLRSEFNNQLTALKQRLSRPPGSGPGDLAANAFLSRPSVGLEQNSHFNAWLSSTRTRLSNFSAELPFQVKAVTPITGTGLPQAYPAMIFGPQQPNLRLAQVMFHAPASSAAVVYTRETAFTPGAALVPEGGLKPASTMTFANVTVNIQTIASIAKASVQALQDTMILASWIDQRLSYAVLLKQEDYLLNDAAGLLALASPLSAGYTPGGTPTTLDFVAGAIDQLTAAGYTPDAVVMNGVDVNKSRLLKDSQGRYLWASPDSASGASRVWAVPLIISPSIAAGTALVGAFGESAILFDRQMMTLEISYENEDDFIHNLACFRAEIRCALAVPVPAGLVKISGLTAAAAAAPPKK
jgi:HK97 family phage major capsid protein